ncbi:MAG TPA: hypothetical protein VN701_00330 [Candidatus Paceibacterota bacterium]|nr:hypothetical protein [Candidatus Paceibacterota bacterium]
MQPEEVFLNAYFASLAQHAPLLLITFVFCGGLATYLTYEATHSARFDRWTPAWYVRLWPGIVIALCILVCVTPIAFLLGFAAADAADALYAWTFFMR